MLLISKVLIKDSLFKLNLNFNINIFMLHFCMTF